MRNLLYYAFVIWPKRTFLLCMSVLQKGLESVKIPETVIPESSKKMIIDLSDDRRVKYTLDKDVTPENVANLAMSFALFADLKFLIRELENNGHKDVEFRLGKEASTYIEKLMGNMTDPDNSGTIGDDKNGVKITMVNGANKEKDSDKPVIEAIAFNGRH